MSFHSTSIASLFRSLERFLRYTFSIFLFCFTIILLLTEKWVVTPQNPGCLIDNPSTREMPLSHIKRPIHEYKWPLGLIHKYSAKYINQLCHNSSRVITLLLIQTHIKIKNSNTCYTKNIKATTRLSSKNRLLKSAVFSNSPCI